jgi:hypothetical protein
VDQRGRQDRHRAAREQKWEESVTPHEAVIGKYSRNPYLDFGSPDLRRGETDHELFN